MPSRNWVIYLLPALLFIAAGVCIAWSARALSASASGPNVGLSQLRQQEICTRIDRYLEEVYTVGSDVPSSPTDRARRLRDVSQFLQREIDTLRIEVELGSGLERSGYLGEVQQLESAARILSGESERLTRAADPVAAPDGSHSQEQLPAVRDAYWKASAAVDRLQNRLSHSLQYHWRKQQSGLSAYYLRGVVFGLVVLSAALLMGILLHRMLKEQRQAKSAKERLTIGIRDAENKCRSIFDNAIEGLFQATPEGRFITVNRALARMYGYDSPEHLMNRVPDLAIQLSVEPDGRAALIETLHQEGGVSGIEMEVVRADGRTMWIRENIRAIRETSGEILHLEGTVEDVSDRRWSEQRRRVQYATDRVLEKAASVAEARPMILQTICEILHWDMGTVWEVNTEEGVLESVEIWHSPHVDISPFQEAVSGVTYVAGEALAGEVWASGEPKWIPNLATDARTVSAQVAIRQGMRSVFCVPIKVDGEVRHVIEFFTRQIQLPDPELLETLGVVAHQIGHLIERKGVEEALRKSKTRKAAILLSALDCIISFDVDGRIVEFNPAAERAFGITLSDALGRDIIDLIVPERMRASHRRAIAMYNAGSSGDRLSRRMEMQAVRSDRSEFPVDATISRIEIDGKAMFTVFLRDISERKEAERVTSELAAVVATSNDAIIACTVKGEIRSWNGAAEEIYGWSSEEAIGQSLRMLIPPDRLEEFPAMLAAVQRGDSHANYETIRLRKDGKKIAVSLTDSPIRTDSGRITGLSSIARDITERKRLEENLLQSQKMDAVGRLAGGIAHDFNNILTAILGYSDLLIGQIDERQWMYKHLSEIRKAADFAAALTHQLLAFSRRQPLYLRVFCINDSVRNMQKMLQRVIGEHIKIRTAYGATIGRLKADPGQIEQVLLNLCVNARDAMPLGGSITISTEDVSYVPDENSNLEEMPAGEYVKLTVSDTGTGIPPDILRHIFEPFFTTKAMGKGTGLGLATCYGIIKQSGGYIAVNSVVGEGTTFLIYLPRVEESGEKAAVRKEVGQLPGGSETILYVEDEHSVRHLTAHVLRKLGYTVLEAGDAEQARAAVTARNGEGIDLLFSDVVLPDLGGRELADWVSAQNCSAKLLFTSGYVDEGILERHEIRDPALFLQKPFTPAEVARKVREVLDRGSLTGTLRT